MVDFEGLTKTDARFKLVETAAINDNAPSFYKGQLIIDDNGSVAYDPSNGSAVSSRINIVTKDVNGKISMDQLPDAILGSVNYQGTWDASTGQDSNGEAIPEASADNKGHYYITSVAGTWPEVDGISYEKGDWLISDGTTWSKVDTADAVTSVNGKTGVVTIGISDIAGLEAAIQAANVKSDNVSIDVTPAADGSTIAIKGAATATKGQVLKKGETTVEWADVETPALQDVVDTGNTITNGTATQTVTAGAIDIADTTGSKQFKVDVTNSTVTGDAALQVAFQEWLEMGAVYRVTE